MASKKKTSNQAIKTSNKCDCDENWTNPLCGNHEPFVSNYVSKLTKEICTQFGKVTDREIAIARYFNGFGMQQGKTEAYLELMTKFSLLGWALPNKGKIDVYIRKWENNLRERGREEANTRIMNFLAQFYTATCCDEYTHEQSVERRVLMKLQKKMKAALRRGKED